MWQLIRGQVVLVSTILSGLLHVGEALDEIFLKVLVPHHIQDKVSTTCAVTRSQVEALVFVESGPLGLLPDWFRQTLKQVLYARVLVVLQQAAMVIVPGHAHGASFRPPLVAVVNQNVVRVWRTSFFSLLNQVIPLDRILVHHREESGVFLLEAQKAVRQVLGCQFDVLRRVTTLFEVPVRRHR